MSEKNVPEVRFGGFIGEWANDMLGELAIFSKGKGFSKSDLINEGYPIILYGRLYTKYETIISEVDTFIANNSNAIISKGNEVIVPASGETAEDISRASVVGGKGIVLGGDLNIIYPNKDLFPIFLALSISNGTQQREMMKRAQGKSVVHLHNSDLCEIKLKYPPKLEQTKIGEFFKNLDNLIAQNQKKYDKLLNMKKACLDKMFPKDGADTPEVRFKGFSEKWEAHLFTDFIERTSIICNRLGLPRVEYEDIIPESGELNKDINKKESNKTGIFFESGDILFGKLRPYLKNWFISDFCGIAVGDFWILKPTEAVGSFVYYLMQNSTFQYISNLSSGTKMPRSDWSIVSKSQFLIAGDEIEQTKIGNFFQTLDNLIALQKTKLEKLKNIKKACLDKMFI